MSHYFLVNMTPSVYDPPFAVFSQFVMNTASTHVPFWSEFIQSNIHAGIADVCIETDCYLHGVMSKWCWYKFFSFFTAYNGSE